MSTITTRAGKGSPLTNAELDANFTNLNADKLEASALSPYLLSATAASTYAPLASPTLTGTPAAPTAAVDTNTTQIATTAYVIGQGYLKSATAASTYQTQSGMSAYLTTASAASTYLTQSNASSTYLTQSNATSTYQTQAGMSSYLTTANAASTYLPLSGGTLTGNLTFSGTGRRITGDFSSNNPITDRVIVQTSAANSNTLWSILPSGTATTTRYVAFNNSDPTNSGAIQVSALSTDVRIQSFVNGTGTAIPLLLMMQGTTVAAISTGNNFLVGTTTDNTTDKLQVAGSASFTGDITVSSTGAVKVSSGTTAQRPTPVKGMLRYNSTTDQFEGYSGSSGAWNPVGGASLTNDTSTSTNLYPTLASSTSGAATTLSTSDAKLLYKPSTGELQASAPVASNGIFINKTTVASSYTIASGTNGWSVGPVTVNTGVTVSISSGQRWIVI